MPERLSVEADKSPPQSGVKGFLDGHPFSSLLGFSITAATIVVGVMTYYTSQRIDAVEMRHKAEMLDLATNDKTTLLDATTPLKQTIADLTFKLSSIERRVIGTGPTYFDVSSVSVGPEAIKALGPNYKAFSGGDFYVAAPEMGNWNYYETSELEFAVSIFTLYKSNLTQLKQIMGDSKLYAWRAKSEIKFQSEGGQIEHPVFTFFPALTVQKITAEFVKNRLGALNRAMKASESSGEMASIKDVAQAVDALNKQVRVDGDAKSGGASKDISERDQSVASADDAGKDVLETLKRKDEIMNNLGAAYSADDASFILTDYLSSAMLQRITLGAHHRVYSAQKKGNVLYLQDQITFQNAQIYDGEKLGEDKQNVVVDSEVFYFGNGSEGYLVKIYLPQVSDRADAFSWTKSWLTGLQIPLG